MKSTLIIGSGFGIYGYLPIMVNNGVIVILPKVYEEKLKTRPDVQCFYDQIVWAPSIDAALKDTQSVIVAVNPQRQFHLIQKCVKLSNIKMMLLEKPLACSPKDSLNSLQILLDSGKKFRIGYNFKFTEWGQDLLLNINGHKKNDGFKIEWLFMAHHFKHKLDIWKKLHQDGGGVIRFYGIHLIALLAELGYQTVKYSFTYGDNILIPDCWSACFAAKSLPDFYITVNSRSSQDVFKLSCLKSNSSLCVESTLFSNTQPYANKENISINKQQDNRHNVIDSLCKTFYKSSSNIYDHYFSAIELWKKVEKMNNFKGMIKKDVLFN